MSFTAEVKEELTRVEPSCSHCDRATLAALVRVEGTLFLSGPQSYRVEIATDVPSVARLVIRLLHSIYQLRTELTIRRSVLHKTPNYLIEIPSQKHLADALVDMGIVAEEGGLVLGIDQRLVSKRCCQAAYIRGVFLGSGFISDPKSDFHFEMIVENERFAEDVVSILNEVGISAKRMARRASHMVYLKSGNAILEFLAVTGAHRSALMLEEIRVVKSVRNDVNRQINAEIANQHKATDAAVRQLFMIRDVLREHEVSTLPPALQEFIRLRVAFPEASLKELGERHDPPLSKSAMNHRLRRLEQMLE